MPNDVLSDGSPLPVIDLFAGPGGLSEGFSAFSSAGKRRFDIRLSIEKDPVACATLRLRKLTRLFESSPRDLHDYMAGKLPIAELLKAHSVEAREAERRTWQAELGKIPPRTVAQRVRRALAGAQDWVLLGGPPCQAYSIVGRARMRPTRADFELDERHFLYREYLRIVADHAPSVFVMENVKGLLTSKHGGARIVSRILNDLCAPGKALGIPGREAVRYRLYPLDRKQGVMPWMEEDPEDGSEFLLKSEEFGIPQMRHRLFIVGVRSDVMGRPEFLQRQPEVTAGNALADLPAIRSHLTREVDSWQNWVEALRAIRTHPWMSAPAKSELGRVASEVRRVLRLIGEGELSGGTDYLEDFDSNHQLSSWYRRDCVGLTHHESRSHMREDLHRYLFCSSYAKVYSRSPLLRDFPNELQPLHENVTRALENRLFTDRFRVQLDDRPSMTITSHISKDGHYFIHPDSRQCRSLTVREAARLQTFPDNYFFEGNRTQQYHQVGNAVPPLLALSIARVVYQVLADRVDTRRRSVAL